jgi:holo-[acyl-carrier protein] synthase
MQKNLERFGERFAARILTDHEIEEFRRTSGKAHYLARRFAAKEAAAKAMGTGFAGGVGLRDIGVVHDENGKPMLEFSGRARELLHVNGVTAANVSLADEDDHAVAFVTLETDGPRGAVRTG